jgi:DNA-binding FadR family transcriptional regulator
VTEPPTADSTASPELAVTSLERFLAAIEEKTAARLHRRLLAACRQQDPAAALKAVLQAAIREVLNET